MHVGYVVVVSVKDSFDADTLTFYLPPSFLSHLVVCVCVLGVFVCAQKHVNVHTLYIIGCSQIRGY